jgi:hypothetical protein
MLKRSARGGVIGGAVADLDPGDVVVFGSVARHEVTPVEAGERIVVTEFAPDGPWCRPCFTDLSTEVFEQR